MSKFTPSQDDFSSGELTPLMGGRSNTEIYNKGLSVLRNMYADSRGPTKNRESLKHVIRLAESTNIKIETYNRSATEFFTFMFVDLKIIFIRDVDNPIITTLVAPWTSDQIKDIYIIPLPDGRTFYLLHPNVPPYKLVDNVGSLVHTTFTSSGDFTVPAGVTSLSVCVCGGGGGGSGNGWTDGGEGGGGGGGGGSGVIKNNAIVVTPAEVIPVTVGSGGAGGAPSVSFDAISGAGANGANSLFAASSTTVTSIGGGGATSAHRTYGGGGGNGQSGGGKGGTASNAANSIGGNGTQCTAICGGSSFLGGIGGQTTGTAGGTGAGGGGGGYGIGGNGGEVVAGKQNGFPGAIGAGGGGNSAGTSGNSGAGGVGQVVVTHTTAAAGLSLTLVTFTGAPVNWTGTNWPSAGAYHKGRLYLGATPNEGETFLGSVVGSPENFTIGTTDSDAMSFVMEHYGRIQWMMSTKALLIGTINGEHIVNPDNSVITPNNIQIDQHSAYGSSNVQPIKIGDQVIYITPDRRKVRAMNYEERKLNWMSVDLTLYSEHITEPLIRDLSWAQHPNNLLWITLDDGTMCCMSYERGDSIQGWHKHDTQGKVLSTGAGFNGQRSVLVVAIERINSPASIDIEMMHADFHVDSWIQSSDFTEYINTDNNTFHYIEGFDHLEGFDVQITVDNAVHGNLVIGADSEPGQGDGVVGRLYLDYNGSVAVVGLGYTAEMETLDIDGGSQTGSGSAHKKRWNKIYIRLLRSGVPLINNERGNDRDYITLMDTPDELISGVVESVSIGWSRSLRINVKQDLPLPLTVLKVFGELKKNAI